MTQPLASANRKPKMMMMSGHLASAQRDMSQVQALLRDAVDHLLADACAIREASRMQQAAAEKDRSGGWEKTLELSQMIDLHAGSALRHLQFQDMVSQLIEHVRNRLDAMAALAGPESSASAGAGLLRHADVPLPESSKPVMAIDMRQGEVELF